MLQKVIWNRDERIGEMCDFADFGVTLLLRDLRGSARVRNFLLEWWVMMGLPVMGTRRFLYLPQQTKRPG